MGELLQLSTEQLKEATQKLSMNMSGPTFDGKLIPMDVCEAYRNGAADHVEFLIGIASNERQIYKSFVGNQKYEVLVDKEIVGHLNFTRNEEQ